MICALCPNDRASQKDGLCASCRSSKNARYPWTSLMDEQLTRIYRAAKNKMDLSTALTIFAKSYRRPRYILLNRAQRLGLRIREQNLWTREEISVLEDFGGVRSIYAIAKMLGRSEDGVKHKMFNLRISGMVTEGFSQREFAAFLGANHQKVARWIDRGWLTLYAERITHDSAERFVWDHMDQYRFTACEEWWIKMMLQAGRHKSVKPGPKPMTDVAFRRSA